MNLNDPQVIVYVVIVGVGMALFVVKQIIDAAHERRHRKRWTERPSIPIEDWSIVRDVPIHRKLEIIEFLDTLAADIGTTRVKLRPSDRFDDFLEFELVGTEAWIADWLRRHGNHPDSGRPLENVQDLAEVVSVLSNPYASATSTAAAVIHSGKRRIESDLRSR